MIDISAYVGADLVVDLRCQFSEGARRCFVLDFNDECALVFQFDYFRPDGYAILRTKDIVSAESQVEWTEMLHGEGFHGGAGLNPFVAIESMKKAIFTLYTCHQNVIVHCDENVEAEGGGYHIGRITSTGYERFGFLFFDSLGNWFETPYEIPYQSVTRIEFRTPYIETFSKYLKKCPIGPL